MYCNLAKFSLSRTRLKFVWYSSLEEIEGVFLSFNPLFSCLHLFLKTISGVAMHISILIEYNIKISLKQNFDCQNRLDLGEAYILFQLISHLHFKFSSFSNVEPPNKLILHQLKLN